jgi:hypothetical protein
MAWRIGPRIRESLGLGNASTPIDEDGAAGAPSARMAETPRSPDSPPPLGPVLRHYGPGLAAIAVAVVVLVAYLDLRGRVVALEEAVSGGAPIRSEPAITPTVAAPDAGPRLQVERGAAPDWPCSGEIAQDLVRQSIGRHGPGVIRCFERRAAEVPGLVATIIVRVRVGSDGSVASVHVAGVEDDALVQCVGNDALTWRFPPPVGGECAIVEAPFALGRRPPE